LGDSTPDVADLYWNGSPPREGLNTTQGLAPFSFSRKNKRPAASHADFSRADLCERKKPAIETAGNFLERVRLRGRIRAGKETRS